jgi:hypothetical protein
MSASAAMRACISCAAVERDHVGTAILETIVAVPLYWWFALRVGARSAARQPAVLSNFGGLAARPAQTQQPGNRKTP